MNADPSPSSRPWRTLVDAPSLQAALAAGHADLVVLDCGFDLGDPGAGERAYAAAHVAGALYVHLDRDLSTAKTGRNGRHPLPTRDAFRATVGGLGVAPGTQVVAYDAQGGMYAARLWWMLRWIGHAEVAVLDGGLKAWQAAGGQVESGVGGATDATDATDATGTTATPPTVRPPYPPRATLVHSIDADALLRQLGRGLLVDARAPQRFRGEVEPLDATPGHIPGAHNRPYNANLAADGRFKPAATLRAEFDALLGARTPAEVTHSCGSGVTACHNLLAMAHAGLDGAWLYPGSWSEWSADPARPVARG